MKDLVIDLIISNPTLYGKATKNDLVMLSDSELISIITKEKKANILVAAMKKEQAANQMKLSKTSDNDIIRFEGIKKSFKDKGGKKEVHKGITFSIKRGETVALLGANGAGKTVLMETLVRVQKQDEGKITYDFEGTDPFKEIGMQFQDADATGNLTPKEMVKFISTIYKDKVSDEQTKEMIDIYGIKEYYDRKIKKLSGGQRQRVNLLLATMHNPKLMILDEFITGLDIVSVRDILEYIQMLKKKNNATLIIISHQPEEIKSLSERVFILKDGMIQNEMLTKDIDRKYSGDFSKFLLEVI